MSESKQNTMYILIISFKYIMYSFIAGIGCIASLFVPFRIAIATIALFCAFICGVIGIFCNYLIDTHAKQQKDAQTHSMKMYFGFIQPVDAITIIVVIDLVMFILALFSIYYFINPQPATLEKLDQKSNIDAQFVFHGISHILMYFAMVMFMSIVYGFIGSLTEKQLFMELSSDLSRIATVIYICFVYFNIFWIRSDGGKAIWRLFRLVLFVIFPIGLSMLRVYNNIYVKKWMQTELELQRQTTDDLEKQEANNLELDADATILYVLSCLSCFVWPVGVIYVFYIRRSNDIKSVNKRLAFRVLIGCIMSGMLLWTVIIAHKLIITFVCVESVETGGPGHVGSVECDDCAAAPAPDPV